MLALCNRLLVCVFVVALQAHVPLQAAPAAGPMIDGIVYKRTLRGQDGKFKIYIGVVTNCVDRKNCDFNVCPKIEPLLPKVNISDRNLREATEQCNCADWLLPAKCIEVRGTTAAGVLVSYYDEQAKRSRTVTVPPLKFSTAVSGEGRKGRVLLFNTPAAFEEKVLALADEPKKDESQRYAGDPLASAYGNTIVIANAKGESYKLWIKKNGTYALEGAKGEKGTGKWALKDGDTKYCSTADLPPNAPAGTPAPKESCSEFKGAHKAGDKWQQKDAMGETITVEIKAGS